MRVHNKVALVTGGASGIGLAFANEILRSGGCVAILDVNRDLGAQVEEALAVTYGVEKVKFFPCDVSNSASIAGEFSFF